MTDTARHLLSTLPRLARLPTEPCPVPFPSLHRDDGCSLFPACLECPYPLCVTEEVQGGELMLSNLLRAKTLALLSCVAGWSVEQIGTRFALSPRHVQRAIGFAETRLSEVWLAGSPQRRQLQRGRPRKQTQPTQQPP